MTEALSIKRKKPADDALSYENLRRDGIKLAQQFSGKLWTDYNLHDPGVTILEQLCYAITDLVYRADLDVADYLTGPDGQIDFERLALHAPQEVFPSRPTTIGDYRKVILDRIAELENVWVTEIKPQGDTDCRGLYHIALTIDREFEPQDDEAVIEKVRRLYGGMRNVCEDVGAITVVVTEPCELCAEIEVTGNRSGADILADIYFQASRLIVGGVSASSYDKAIEEGEELERLFDGPLTSRGWYEDATLTGQRQEILVSELFSVVNAIDGVDHVSRLCLEKDGKSYYESLAPERADAVLNLLVPRDAAQIKVRLSGKGRAVPIAINDLRAKFDELKFSCHCSGYGRHGLDQLCQLPRGSSVRLKDYFSIQNHFPIVYGIGPQGVPASAPPEEKAKALQLKGYLLIFEQLMANYLANLDSIKSLFSCDELPRVTYAHQPLDGKVIADVEKLYSANAGRDMGDIVKSFDNYNDRKGRLLDYLLALYGERFSQKALRHFNYYCDPRELGDVITANKVAYLRSVVQLGRDRTAAVDYNVAGPRGQAQCGLQRRIRLLLGFEQQPVHSLTSAILKHGLKLMPHSHYEIQATGDEDLLLIDMETLGRDSRAGFVAVPELSLELKIDPHTIRDEIGGTIPLKNNLLSDLLLKDGINIERYSVGSLSSGMDYQLLFQVRDGLHWHLGTYGDAAAGVRAAHALRHFLIRLNRESEGLHLVEHILLRPSGSEGHENVTLPPGQAFYSFRISVLFPAWTARCDDSQFRMLAEETVRLNVPANVWPEFYWLNFHKMYEFELLHDTWLQLKSKKGADTRALDTASAGLINFLVDHRQDNNRAERRHVKG